MNQPVDLYSVHGQTTVAVPAHMLATSTDLFLFGQTPLLIKLLNRIQIGQLHLTLPNGDERVFRGPQDGIHADLQIHDVRAFGAISKSADIGLAESYREGWLDSSDLLALLQLALSNEAALTAAFQGKWYGKLFYQFKHWQNRNTKSGSKKNIHAHYDLGNEFYQLWLDPSMTYSSALFSDDNMSLEQAQIQKYARLFESLNVQAGDHVLEIGCGWGGFAEYAASRGVRVTGVSLSREQLQYAHRRLHRLGLSHLTDLRFQDYRDIRIENDKPYDAIVSIEMIEAVGESFWPSYFKQLFDLVKVGGMVSIQAITIDEARFNSYRASTDFIQQYIFPGGMLASPTRLRQEFERVGLTWIDGLSFGHDYARTLYQWRQAFEQHLDQIRTLGFDEGFIRIWRFYYIYCEAGFLSDRTSVYQVIAQRPVS